MRNAPLPVRLEARVREPLSAYAVRLADANGVSKGLILARYRHDIDIPESELAVIASLADLESAAVTGLTMNRYPLAIRGHGPQRRHGWRLHHSVTWNCPVCTHTTGHKDILRQTALMPACLRCGCYLVRSRAPHTVRPAHPRVLDLAETLSELAEASIEDRAPRRLLYRLRRRCQTMAATLSPGRPDDVAGLPPVDVAAARRWGAYPSPDPGTVATILVLSGRRLGRKKPARTAPARYHQEGQFKDADRDRLTWFLTRIRHHVTRNGLRPDHVPTLLPRATDDTARPRPGQWLSLTRAATGLHMLISQVVDGPASTASSTEALGVPGIPSSLLIEGIHTGQGLRQHDADLLAAALDQLLTDGLIDYQRRRDILRTIRGLPSSTTRQLAPTATAEPGYEHLALAWIWTRFTHGPMRSSPWPSTPDRDIHAFDRRIDPETRLVLHDTGKQLLADADLLTTCTPPATTVGALVLDGQAPRASTGDRNWNAG